MPVTCTYCDAPAVLVGGDRIYPHRPDLHARKFWLCADCDAFVGCHRGTTKPLGTLAGADLRRMRSRAHAKFDPIWKNGSMPRTEAYAWLAGKLGIEPDACHIAMFDSLQCIRTIEACDARRICTDAPD